MVERIRQYIKSLEKDSIPQLSINCVIFGFHEKTLKVIVNKISFDKATLWLLPGGYIGQQEDLSDAVARIVKESTGLEKMLFKQFAVFGKASRSFRKEFAALNNGLSDSEKDVWDWVSKRFVTICYLALVDFNKIELKPTQFLEVAQWLPVDKGKTLAIDHSEIVKSARQSLLRELPHSPVASNLLPAKFTLPELQALIEAIAGKEIDRPNFRRKVLKSDLITKVGQDVSGKRRPADLYAFKHGKRTSLNEAFKFGF
jgi:8-oxo-dGTP diphosphatase